ncbi:hypothetical protein LC612_42290 [Nostoc sp. CHAB 5834]|nr:hypothetical protein [Nostoc sp. CHAB 5834]
MDLSLLAVAGVVGGAFCILATYQLANNIRKSYGAPPPQVFGLRANLRELSAAFFRKLKGYPTLKTSATDSVCYSLFATEGVCSRSSLESNGQDFLRELQENSKFYPEGQMRVAEQLLEKALRHYLLIEQEKAARCSFRQSDEVGVTPVYPTSWRTVLGMSVYERDPAKVKLAYARLARKAHPDRGGSDAAMAELNLAMQAAREELNFGR